MMPHALILRHCGQPGAYLAVVWVARKLETKGPDVGPPIGVNVKAATSMAAMPVLGKFIGFLLLAFTLYAGYEIRAFRIRDGDLASTEQTRSSCGLLFGKSCIVDKAPTSSADPGDQRRRNAGASVTSWSTKSIRPPVEVGNDVVSDLQRTSRPFPSKSEKVLNVKISEHVRLRLKTGPVSRSGGRAGMRMRVTRIESEDDVEERLDDSDEATVISDDVDESGDDESDEDDEDDEDDEEEDEDEGEKVGSKADSDEDEDEDDDESDVLQDDEDDEDDDDRKGDVSNDRKLILEDSVTGKDLEKSEEVEEQLMKRDVKAWRRSSMEDNKSRMVKIAGKVTGIETTPKSINVVKKGTTIFRDSKIDVVKKIDDEVDSKDDVETKEDSTPSSRKLEKVRLANKTKSAETVAVKSIEIDSRKFEEKRSVEDRIDVKKVVKPPTVKPELPKLKSEEKSKVKVETEKVKTDSSKSRAETKEQPKRSEESKSKGPTVSEPKIASRQPNKKNETKPIPKKRTEASVTLTELNSMILHVTTFVPNFTAIEDPVCQQQGKIFLRQLRGYKLWALQMLDSNAKVPSGLLRGNVNQLGDFDQCLGVTARVKVAEKTVKVQGKYCLATVDLHATHPDMKVPVNLMQGRAFIRGSMRDPGHFVPRFTTVNWALCLPAACSAEDAQIVMENALSSYNVTAGLRFNVNVEPNMCHVRQKSQSYSKETIGVLYFYAMTICLVLVATLRDFCVSSEKKGSYSERIIMSFSLRRTFRSLLQDVRHTDDGIRCIDGIRSLVTITLYVAHKLIPISNIPFANRVALTEITNNPISSILRVSAIYTDCFLLLSGFLTAYNMAKELKTRGEIRWFCRFVARFIRLTPSLLVVVFWYAFVMEHIGSGPLWNSAVTVNAELCKRNAWTNLLYIQNFFPFEDMCATHTHQLALDMQLSLLAPMLVFFLHCKPILGILLIFFLLQVSATVRYLTTMNNYLSLVIFHGMSVKHLYKTANLTYTLPLHRATPYLFGVGLGVLLNYTGKNIRVHKAFVILGWLIAIVLGSWSLFSPWRLAKRDYTYDLEEATHFAVFCPISWALVLCWIIFASFTGHGGIINRLLSSSWLMVISRISYAIYLTQFAVFFYNVGTTRYSSEFQLHRAIDPFEVTTVIIVSVVLTLMFDLPMQEVKKVIMESTDGLTIEAPDEKGSNEENTMELKDGVVVQNVKSKLFEDDEVESTGWDWQKDIVEGGPKEERNETDGEELVDVWSIRSQEGRRKSFMRHDAEEREEVPTWDWIKGPGKRALRNEEEEVEGGRRSRSSQRSSLNDSADEARKTRQQQQQKEDEEQEEEVFKRDRRSQSKGKESRRSTARNSAEPFWRERSSSRTSETKRHLIKEVEDSRQAARRERSESKGRSLTGEREEHSCWEFVGRERSASRGIEGKTSLIKGIESQEPTLKTSRGSLSISKDSKRIQSSESDEEPIVKRRTKSERKQLAEEPRMSNEENWEHELRLRRRKVAEDMVLRGRRLSGDEEDEEEEEEEEWNSLRRRSSAEGKIALLKDPPVMDSMRAWNVGKVPKIIRMSSSQEPSEGEEEGTYFVEGESSYRGRGSFFREREDTQSEEESSWDRRRSYTSGSQPTSVDDEEDLSAYDFVLRKESKRISLQNLSKLSQEEEEAAAAADVDGEDSGWNLVKEKRSESVSVPQSKASSGLFKRESIVKSQPSEEDPEYLLPERPKLMEQEEVHPFKKAWQEQKSRSEEEGPSGFLMKDGKQHQGGSGIRKDSSQREDSSASKRRTSGGLAEDLGYLGSDEIDSTLIDGQFLMSRQSSKSETEENVSCLEDEQFSSHVQEPRRRSEEVNWNWEQEET